MDETIPEIFHLVLKTESIICLQASKCGAHLTAEDMTAPAESVTNVVTVEISEWVQVAFHWNRETARDLPVNEQVDATLDSILADIEDEADSCNTAQQRTLSVGQIVDDLVDNLTGDAEAFDEMTERSKIGVSFNVIARVHFHVNCSVIASAVDHLGDDVTCAHANEFLDHMEHTGRLQPCALNTMKNVNASAEVNKCVLNVPSDDWTASRPSELCDHGMRFDDGEATTAGTSSRFMTPISRDVDDILDSLILSSTPECVEGCESGDTDGVGDEVDALLDQLVAHVSDIHSGRSEDGTHEGQSAVSV